MFLGAVVVIAANSGGAWTLIGDVTTTMLWIHGQISTLQTIKDLFLPSVVSLVVPLTLLSYTRFVRVIYLLVSYCKLHLFMMLTRDRCSALPYSWVVTFVGR